MNAFVDYYLHGGGKLILMLLEAIGNQIHSPDACSIPQISTVMWLTTVTLNLRPQCTILLRYHCRMLKSVLTMGLMAFCCALPVSHPEMFLIGTVTFVLGIGLYELFISTIDSSYGSNLFGLFSLPVGSHAHPYQ